MHLVQRIFFVFVVGLFCFGSFVNTSPVVPGSKNVILLDLTLINGTTIQNIELPSSYCWITKVITDTTEEFTADIIPLDISTNSCSIANPPEQTKNKIGVAYVTRETSRGVFANGCSHFQLVAAAQRENFMDAVILIRNDSALNNEWEGGYFFEGTTSLIFTEIQAYESILNRYGGSAQIARKSARVLAAPDDVIAAWTDHVVHYTGQLIVTCLLSGFSFLWAVVLLPFRLKYYPITSKTLLAFFTILGIIILTILRLVLFTVDYRNFQVVYSSLGYSLVSFAGDTMIAVVFSVVVVAWLEASIWKRKERISRILRWCCLGLNIGLFLSLTICALIDGLRPGSGATTAGNIIVGVCLLIITVGFLIAGGRLVHIMSRLSDSKTERNNRDKILRKKIAAVMTMLGILGLYAVVNNFTTSALQLNADLSLSLVFGLRFAENMALWVILWFFTDTVVHRADSSMTSVSSSKGKSRAQFSAVNSRTNTSVAGTASEAPRGNNTRTENQD